MKKGVLFLVFALIFTMLAPAHAAQLPQNQMQEVSTPNSINGKYVISVKEGDDWNEIGALNFGKFQSTETINLGNFNGESIKLSRDGGGAAYLDAVLLDGLPAVKANNYDETLLNKLTKEDLDIIPISEEGVVLEFENGGENSILTVVARIENVNISKEPLQFPAENNYKSTNNIGNFYTYEINSNLKTVIVDGMLDEVESMEPFVSEYRVPDSGHPAGYIYFWVMNDDENLYVTMDTTPDNTFDGDKDYAKVYVNTDKGIKEFRVSVPETNWGKSGFTYTDKVNYEHKIYEFAIPLSEIDALKDDKIGIAFVAYGTMSYDPDYNNPDIAYDYKKDNDLYLSVFEYETYTTDSEFLGTHIYGEIVENDGTVLATFPIRITYPNYECYQPIVAYDKANNRFLVVWSEYQGDNLDKLLMGCTVTIDRYDTDKVSYNVGPAYNILGDDLQVVLPYECDKDIDYGNNGSFLLTFQASSNDEYGIYGKIVDSNNNLDNNIFTISNTLSDEQNPRVCYSPKDNAYLVAWNYWNISGGVVEAQIIDTGGNLKSTAIISEGAFLNDISLNTENNQFFIITEEESGIKGQYYYINSEFIPVGQGNKIKIAPDNIYANSPVAYNDGNGNMLCTWIDETNAEGNKYYAMLQYLDDKNSYIGAAFYPDEYDMNYPKDNLRYYDSLIATSGDNNGKVIIAYAYEPDEEYYMFMDEDNEYDKNMRYLVFGEPSDIQPYIEFSNAPFDEIFAGETIQTEVKLYNKEFPNGKEINEDLYYFSEKPEIASIDRDTGLITGISEGETNVHAVYDPFAESDSDDVKFSDGLIIMKKPEKVKVIPKPEPTLEFDKETYSVQMNKTIPFIVTLSNYNDIKSQNVTQVVAYNLGNPEIASISTGGAITGLAVGTTTVSAIYTDGEIEMTALATIAVNPVPQPPSGSSAPARTPIGQILVNNKVIETLYEENVDAKNNTYTFIADKSSETARLWLDSKFYDNLAEDYPNRIIQFKWDSGTYTLPLNCNEVLNEIDNKAQKVNILIEKVDDKAIIEAANKSAESLGADVISELIDFSVFIEKNSGNTEIESYDFYAERTINKLNIVDKYISTAMKFVEDKEILTFAPSVFNDDYATIKYRGNGIFTIIKNPQTFNDITNHWAKLNIEKLATRNIAFGKENNNFVPNDFITRAEFAVMITRALGITEEEGANDFIDVSNEWYAEDISTAFVKGLINGRNDGKFYPNEKIQRKDMAVIIQNALKFTGMTIDISNADSILSMFKDESIISNYAREATSICADAGIIMGRETKNFDPDANATRAEATAIIERMLKFIEFMD
ncbi:MAG: metallophosphoesterase [Sedimentibacter sp.]|nr:metallophosphoesterase [Sedimentibacter sp.]